MAGLRRYSLTIIFINLVYGELTHYPYQPKVLGITGWLNRRLESVNKSGSLLRFTPYLSGLCVAVGVAWLLLLPLNEYSRQTYISENALLPGQVHTYFGGSEHNVFRAYRHEVALLVEKSEPEISDKLASIFKSCGLKVARQKYRYDVGRESISGENVYAILQGPRADATEAIVLIGPWRNMDGQVNQSGVALVLTLARYFKRWSLWSKDIIFLITGDSVAGPQAWVDAYHEVHLAKNAESLSLKSGALQGAVAIDYPAGPWGHRFEKVHILYDGNNGQLPNLDLFNTVVSIAANQLGIGVALQRMWHHNDGYRERLLTMLRGMLSQGTGHATGPHSAFIPYHVDAITLQTVGDGWHDEMSLGRLVEGAFRSLNNLLEHFHQSFFFYLLMQSNRFVSIGTYLPSAMLVAVNFTISCISLWIASGQDPVPPLEAVKAGQKKVNKLASASPGRELSLPAFLVVGTHFIGLFPLLLFNRLPQQTLGLAFYTFAVLNVATPPLLAFLTRHFLNPTEQVYTLTSCFSLLLLGMFLSALATVNFSLAFLVGLLSVTLSFVRQAGLHLTTPASAAATVTVTAAAPAAVATRTRGAEKTRSKSPAVPPPSEAARSPRWPSPRATLALGLLVVILNVTSPPAVLVLVARGWNRDVADLLAEAARGWHVSGLWTQVVVWLVWWPAWFAGAVVLYSSFLARRSLDGPPPTPLP